jgi:hypothetical protein
MEQKSSRRVIREFEQDNEDKYEDVLENFARLYNILHIATYWV